MKNIISAEICKKCGECCRNYPYVELSKNDINSLEQKTALYFDQFTNQKGTTGEDYFLQFQENGNCVFLKENNGCYSCDVYAARPAICKKYPVEPLQKKVCDANMDRYLSCNAPSDNLLPKRTVHFFRHLVANRLFLSLAPVFTKWRKKLSGWH